MDDRVKMVDMIIERLNLRTTMPDPEVPWYIREYVQNPVPRVEIPSSHFDRGSRMWLTPCPEHRLSLKSIESIEDLAPLVRVPVVEMRRSDLAFPDGFGVRRFSAYVGQCEECMTIYWSIIED